MKSKEMTRSYQRDWYYKNRERVLDLNRARQSQPTYRYHELLRSAKKRGLEMCISRDSYFTLIKNECFFCKKDYSMEMGAGLDRIDNSKGYTLDNVHPCCKNCNMTRGDRSSVEETLVMVTALERFKKGLSTEVNVEMLD